MPTLRSRLIRLASQNPELRSEILPLLKSAKTSKTPKSAMSIPDIRSLRDLLKRSGYNPDYVSYLVQAGITPEKLQSLLKSPGSLRDFGIYRVDTFTPILTEIKKSQMSMSGAIQILENMLLRSSNPEAEEVVKMCKEIRTGLNRQFESLAWRVDYLSRPKS